CSASDVSAGDVQVVADVVDADRHPGGVDHRVVLGPGANVPGQGHSVPVGVHRHVAVVEDQRVAVQCVLYVHGDVDRIGVVADRDVVAEVADAGQPGHRVLGRGPLGAVAHRAGQRQVAVLGRRLDT